MNYKVGDRVLCIEEKDIPNFVGKMYTISEITYNHTGEIRLINVFLDDNSSSDRYDRLNIFPFFPSEIVPVSSLIEELL
jgi:hypothetical protein